MPSPLLHSAAGLCLARFEPGAAPGRKTRVITLAALMVAANAPDLDFLPGILMGDALRFHHGPSHSLLAAGLIVVCVGLLAKWSGSERPVRFGLLTGLAFSTHLLLDMLSSISDERHGVALLWPLFTERLATPVPIFVGIWLDPGADTLLQGVIHRRNAIAVLWELAVLGATWSIARAIDTLSQRERAPNRARIR